MKKLQQICATLALTLALVLSASAGVIGTDKTPPPPSADGIITTWKTGTTADTATEIALGLLQSVIALF
ncbi:MAG: hypothetical protein ACR2G4_00700 [Pyrinomonadaceae bacterium]